MIKGAEEQRERDSSQSNTCRIVSREHASLEDQSSIVALRFRVKSNGTPHGKAEEEHNGADKPA